VKSVSIRKSGEVLTCAFCGKPLTRVVIDALYQPVRIPPDKVEMVREKRRKGESILVCLDCAVIE
jgi:ribosomal protein L34E